MHGRQEARQTLLLLNKFSYSGSLESKSGHDQTHVNDLRDTSIALALET
jgi:hypothetical protein